MGCFFSKQPEEKFEILKEVEDSDVPCWEKLEWENMLRKNDLTMDQINLELKQNILRDQECIFQQRSRNLEADEGNLEEAQMHLLEEKT